MEARFPMAITSVVSEYFDSVRDSATDHSKSLVGANPTKFQIGAAAIELAPLALLLRSAPSYQGDCNPLHDHGGNTPLWGCLPFSI
jgi:hypothetical protein